MFGNKCLLEVLTHVDRLKVSPEERDLFLDLFHEFLVLGLNGESIFFLRVIGFDGLRQEIEIQQF